MNHALTTRAAAIALLAAALSTSAESATYYVHASAGNDWANDGLSSSKPWKTLTKANATAVPGDTVLLSGGTTWQETLYVKSGITYNTYGSPAPAIINGGRSVGRLAWSLYKPGVYVATTNASIESGSITQVWAGDTRLIRARTPNVGSGAWGAGSRYAMVTQEGDFKTLHIAAGSVPAAYADEVKGATVFTRNVGSDLNEHTVTEVTKDGDGRPVVLTLAHVSILGPNDWDIAHDYPIFDKSGYWIENKLWMLDAPKEWFFDAPAHRLYISMPDGGVPNSNVLVSSQKNGIVADGVSNFRISNILVQNTASDGIYLNHTSGATLSNVTVLRAGRRGIAMAGSRGNTILNSYVDRSATEGIWLGYVPTSSKDVTPYSMRSVNTTITGTTVANSGAGGYALAAVLMGEGGSFSYGKVLNTPFVGIFATLGNRIEGNLVQNSCSDFEDCGGIYVGQPAVDPAKDAAVTDRTQPYTAVLFPNNVVINRNMVDTGTGSTDGVPPGLGTDTRGIYLDDYTNGVTVTNNYVTGMRHGYMLHTAFKNVLSGNLAIRNRSHNLLLQEDKVLSLDEKRSLPGLLSGNRIQGNAMVAGKDPSDAGLAIPNIKQTAENGLGDTLGFASYADNQYATLNPNAPTTFLYNYGSDIIRMNLSQDMSFAVWQQNLQQDVTGRFRAYQASNQAWGFYNPATASASITIDCIAVGMAPSCGPVTNLLTGETKVLPFPLLPGNSIILVK